MSQQLAGEQLWLLSERAIWWPATATLFIADVHIGKAAVFRARGVPVPAGTTAANIGRLDRLLAMHQASRLVVLGDLLHAAEAQDSTSLAELAQWRDRWPDVDMVLVRGNHDLHAGDPPASLRMRVVAEPYAIGPFVACHQPQRHPSHHVLAGHVHPAVRLRGRGHDGLRLPCFVLEEGSTVLPAFGEFTGQYTVAPAPGRRLCAVGADAVWHAPG